ncbi:MAG: hypothetical protein GQ532_18235 [Methylomarinum sp.]|nr:hypothetical protein [Methylomarinum sp.]
MYTQSLSPSFSLPQAFLRGEDSVKHQHSRDKDIEGNHHHKLHAPRVADSYEPTQLGEMANPRDISSRMAMQSLSTSTSHSADIQVTTKEGDVVTISLNQSASSSRSSFYAEQGNNKIAAYEESSSFSSGFSMSVEGDLNEDEQKSLTDLINKMSKVSDKFFKGNINAAFKHAQKIGFDTEQISGFSMSLNKERSIQAVAAYQQIAMPEQNVNTDLLKQASDFLTQTKEFMADTRAALDSLSEPKQAFADLFAGIGQMHLGTQEELDSDKDEALFLKIIENIGDELLDNKEDE